METRLLAERAGAAGHVARSAFPFFFLVLVGALLAYFYFSMQMSRRDRESPSAERIERDR